MICPICNNSNFGEHENKGALFLICKNCGYIIQTQQSDEYDKTVEKATLEREQKNIKPTVECPYCHSTNTKKITNTSKVVHTALFGIFSMSRNSKQFHCNQCNSDF